MTQARLQTTRLVIFFVLLSRFLFINGRIQLAKANRIILAIDKFTWSDVVTNHDWIRSQAFNQYVDEATTIIGAKRNIAKIVQILYKCERYFWRE